MLAFNIETHASKDASSTGLLEVTAVRNTPAADRPVVVVVDDQQDICELLKAVLEDVDCKVIAYTNPLRALEGMATHGVDVLLTDIELPGMDGFKLLETVRGRWPQSKVVVFTGYGRVELAVRALKLGATDFLTKPLNCCIIADMVKKLLTQRPVSNSLDRSTLMRLQFGGRPEIQALVNSAAPTTCSILITGESGTGKEVLADYIHSNSKRREQPYIKVNCAALSESLIESELFGHEQGAFTGANKRHTGRFERSQHGTVFLDEIAELSLPMQTKLLRVLQTQEIERVGGTAAIKLDFRLICATHRNLDQMVEEGKFRQDLYFRINTVPIHLPPLRERVSEISHLASTFVEKTRSKIGHDRIGISLEAVRLLETYTWPGNIRELEHCIERACLVANQAILQPEDFRWLQPSITHSQELAARTEPAPVGVVPPVNSPPATDALSRFSTLENAEREALLKTLQAHEWNYTRTALSLGISRSTLYTKANKYGLTRNLH